MCDAIRKSAQCSLFFDQKQEDLDQQVQKLSFVKNSLLDLQCEPLLKRIEDGTVGDILRYAGTFECQQALEKEQCRNTKNICTLPCAMFQQTLQATLTNPTFCIQTADTEILKKRQELIVSIGSTCKLESPFVISDQCVEGIPSEFLTCGFGSSKIGQEQLASWCERMPQEKCCIAFQTQSNSTKLGTSSPTGIKSITTLNVGMLFTAIIGMVLILSSVGYLLCKYRSKFRKTNRFSVFEKSVDFKNESVVRFSTLDSLDSCDIPSPIREDTKAVSKSIMISTVTHSYEKQRPDELGLSIGDSIIVSSVYSDGWGHGLNANTGKSGVFPVVCIACEDRNE
jgi:hypothetical protein